MKNEYVIISAVLYSSLFASNIYAGFVPDYAAMRAHNALLVTINTEMAAIAPLEKNYKDTLAKIEEIESLLSVRSDLSSIKLVVGLINRPENAGKLGLNDCTSVLLFAQWKSMIKAFEVSASQSTRDDILSLLDGGSSEVHFASELPTSVVEGFKRVYSVGGAKEMFLDATDGEISAFFEVLDASVLFPLKSESMAPIQFASKMKYLTDLTGRFALEQKKRGEDGFNFEPIFSELAQPAAEVFKNQTIQTLSTAYETLTSRLDSKVPAYLQRIALNFQNNHNSRQLAQRALESHRQDLIPTERLYNDARRRINDLNAREPAMRKAASEKIQVGDGGHGRHG